MAQGPLPGFWLPGLLPWPSCLITVCRDPCVHHHSAPGRREKGRLIPSFAPTLLPQTWDDPERGHASIVTFIHHGDTSSHPYLSPCLGLSTDNAPWLGWRPIWDT